MKENFFKIAFFGLCFMYITNGWTAVAVQTTLQVFSYTSSIFNFCILTLTIAYDYWFSF